MAVLLAPAAAVALSALLLTCGGPSSPPASGPVPFETIRADASGALLGERREALIRDDAAWSEWRASLSLPESSPAEGRPEPDFTKDVVLAVDGEDGSNGCHAVRIVRVVAEGSVLKVDVVRYRPGPTRACTQAMIRPSHAVAVRPGAPVEKAVFSWTDAVGEPAP